MGKNWENNGMAADKSQKQERIRAEMFILRHWWMFVISEIRSQRPNIKMIQDHTQHLPIKDHQLHKWRPQKS